MTIDKDDLLNSIMESLSRIQYIKSADIPNIDLYMDQVTTFMDKRLRNTTRDPDGDKVMTKTMINNYAKNNLLPSPEKKKYSKEHIVVLVFIYYLKGLLSINDIQTLLNPLTERFFDKPDMAMVDVYEEVFRFTKAQIDVLKRDVAERYAMSREMFQDAPADSEDFLKMFSFICMLGYDVYVKKLLIEKMVDGLREQSSGQGKREEKKPDGKKAATKKPESGKKGSAGMSGGAKAGAAGRNTSGKSSASGKSGKSTTAPRKPDAIRKTEAAKRMEAGQKSEAHKKAKS